MPKGSKGTGKAGSEAIWLNGGAGNDALREAMREEIRASDDIVTNAWETYYAPLFGGVAPNRRDTPRAIKIGGVYYVYVRNEDSGNIDLWSGTSPTSLTLLQAGVVVPGPGAWDANNVWASFVTYVGGVVRLFYFGSPDYDMGLASGAAPNALIKQGAQGRVMDVTPLTMLDFGGIYDEDDSTYKCWFPSRTFPFPVYYATSPDGLSWTVHYIVFDNSDANYYEISSIDGLSVTKINGIYWMFYDGRSGGTKNLCVAASLNGVSWVKKGEITVPPLTWYRLERPWVHVSPDSLTVINDGGVARGWFSGDKNAAATPQEYIGYIENSYLPRVNPLTAMAMPRIKQVPIRIPDQRLFDIRPAAGAETIYIQSTINVSRFGKKTAYFINGMDVNADFKIYAIPDFDPYDPSIANRRQIGSTVRVPTGEQRIVALEEHYQHILASEETLAAPSSGNIYVYWHLQPLRVEI